MLSIKFIPKKLFASAVSILAFATIVFANGDDPQANLPKDYFVIAPAAVDTIPFNQWYYDWLNGSDDNRLDLKDPSIIKKEVEYDPEKNRYIITEKMGDEDYRPPTYMTYDEYMKWSEKEAQKEYFKKLSGVGDANVSSSGIVDPVTKFNIEDNLVDRLFGGTKVDIRPQGNIDLTFGWNYSRRKDPGLTIRQQTNSIFDFDMNINMSVQGKIGEKLNLNFNYNSKPTFDFDNQMKIQYDPTQFTEDDIIQNIEAGDVSLPLKGTLIQGAQSLFGIRLDTKWGKLKLSTIIAQQKSDREELVVQGGAQFQEYEVYADEYEENRHFFLSHYNRNVFEESLVDLPVIRNVFKLERVQVFLTDDRNTQPDRLVDIVAFADLGEAERITNTDNIRGYPNRNTDYLNRSLPDNTANDLFDDATNDPRTRQIQNAVFALQNPPFNMQQSRDFEKVSAVILTEGRDYTVNPELGFVSLNYPVQPDHVVGISYQYSYNGEIFQVGEFSNKVPPVTFGAQTGNDPDQDTTRNQTVVFTKMLKSATQRVDLPLWDLMMKNVYNIGAYNVNPDDFQFSIFYDEPGIGEKQFLPAETKVFDTPLISLFNLDRLNSQNDPCPDGEFDFVPGLTINQRNGRVMFPLLEPFGSSLTDIFKNSTNDTIKGRAGLIEQRYAYNILYDSTVTRAREYPDKNRFVMRGIFKSETSNEIILNAINIPRNSLRVTAGGRVLVEGQDYEVDYNIGRLRILDDSYIASGVPINVSFEDRSLFGFQQKNLIGVRADYDISKNFQVGATYMHLFERPFTQKVNIGDDPINNRVYGLDMAWGKEVPFFTKMVDALPFIDTKAASSINFVAEAAAIQPGHSRAINEGLGDDKGGVVMIDDFEGAFPELTLSSAALQEWVLASVPQNDIDNNNPLFPEAKESGTISGVNRALLNWFVVDESSRRGSLQSPYTDQVSYNEIFREGQVQSFQNITRPLVINYNPEVRGPYNFDLPQNGTEFSKGVTSNGALKNPETRWAGITRNIQNNDFEANNVEFVEFWLLSPYHSKTEIGQPSPDADRQKGDIYINIGNISEDALRDSRLSYENGLPGTSATSQNRRTDKTPWGNVPSSKPQVQAFDTDQQSRLLQDVGLDGMGDDEERTFYSDFITQSMAGLNATAAARIQADPSNDNFEYFLNKPDSIPVLDRYQCFNNPEGNSPVNQDNRVPQSSRLRPDTEDLNDDRTLNEAEAYFQYKIPIEQDPNLPQGIKFNKYVRDSVMVMSNQGIYRIWYNIQVPIADYEAAVGGIQDFRSIRFIRMFWHGFETETTFSMVDMKLTRSQWRKYKRPLKTDGIGSPPDLFPPTEFNITDVGLVENSTRVPFSYILPEGIQREQAIGGFQQNQLQDEKSIAITLGDLQDGDARGIYKLTKQDLRLYDRMRMFVHAERDSVRDAGIRDGDLSAFIRLGSDFEDNYYEYEIPLTFSRDESIDKDLEPLEYSREVWKVENNFDFEFDLLKDIKIQRNDEGYPFNTEFKVDSADVANRSATVRVKGNPDLGNVKGIMIGLRNKVDDGVPHSAQIWVNELRVNGLDERGGVAALARMDIALADFGQLTVAGNYSGIGYGGIDQKLIQRNQEEVKQYDLSAQFELGRFFGEKSGIKLPVLAQYSNLTSTPRFDPNTGDIEVDELKAKSTNTSALLDTILTKSEIKTINLTNVRKERTNTERKPMPWDIANFTASYGYTERNDSDPKTELAETKDHYGTLDYSWNMKPLTIKPLKKLIKKDKYLKFLSEFNFNPIPQSFTFGTAIDRDFHRTKRRFAGANERFNTFHEKKFIWDRDYNLNWDFARSLKFNFTATNMSIIDELKEFDDNGTKRSKQELNDHILNNVRDLGRTRDYTHTASLSYQVPLKNFPMLEWINARAQYNATYGWTGASLNATELGNVIQNSQKRDLSAEFNFEKLYNKSSYLKKINRKNSGRKKSNRRDKVKGGKDKNPDSNKKVAKPDKKKKKSKVSTAEKALIRPLMLLRSARLRYSEDYNTVVPGFMPQSKLLGMSEGFNAPGWEFIGGLQPTDKWFNQAADEWITEDFFLNQKVQQNYTQSIDGKVQIEPISDFRIDIDLRKKFTENHSEYFKDTEADGIRNIERLLPQDMGSMELTYFSANTLFGQDQDGIELFEQYEANRAEISRRIGDPNTQHANTDEAAYTRGFGRIQQDVLIPAFVSAYSGTNASTTKLNIFKTLPLPNWTVNYTGLSKVGRFKDLFKRVSLKHGYKSTLTVNSFRTDLNYDPSNATGNTNINPESNNFYSKLEIPDVVIREGFSPLIGVQIETKNNLSIDFSMDKQRDLQMNLFTYQLAENRTSAYKAGFQYTMKGVQFDWLRSKKKKGRGGKDKNLGNQLLNRAGSTFGNSSPQDMNIGLQFQLNDDITINHFLDQDIHERIRGQFVLRISPSVDYQMNNQLNLRLFVDYTNTRPKTSQTPPTTNIFGGLTVSFNLQ